MQKIIIMLVVCISIILGADPMLLASFKSHADAKDAVNIFDKIFKSAKKRYRPKVLYKEGLYQIVVEERLSAIDRKDIVETVNAYFTEGDPNKAPKKKKYLFSGKAVLGIGYDDNAHHHTDIDTTPYANILIDNNTSRLSDTFHREIFVLQHQYQFSDTSWNWASVAMLYNKSYNTYDDLNLLQLAFYTGPQYNFGKHRTALSAYEKKLWYGGEAYLDTYGIIARYQYRFNEHIRSTIEMDISEKRFVEASQKDQDSNRIELKGSMGLVDDERLYFLGELGVYGERRVQGGRTDVSYDAFYIAGKYLYPIWKDTLFSTKLSYEMRDYNDKHPNLPKREEDKWRATLELSQKVTEDITMKLNYTYTHNDSTINLYTYESSVVLLNMSTSF